MRRKLGRPSSVGEDTIIYGRNAVREALRAGHVHVLYANGRLVNDPLVKEARGIQADVRLVEERELTRMARNPSHQGLVAMVEPYGSHSLKELVRRGQESGRKPLILMLDGIEDPQNLGAILRSADAFGVDGVIVPRRGSAPLGGTVAKVSTGAIEHVMVHEATNLRRAVDELKGLGYWVVAAEGTSETPYDEVDYGYPTLLIVGSEGFGISRILMDAADFRVRIPMLGHVNSLNASVSAGILLANILRSRS